MTFETQVELLCKGILKKSSESLEERNKCMVELKTVVLQYDGEAQERIKDLFSQSVFSIIWETIKEVISDGESQRVQETCDFLTALAKVCGEHMTNFLGDAFIHILDGLKIPTKLLSGYVDECIISIIQSCTFKMGIPIIVKEIKENQTEFVRERCLEYIHKMLTYWDLTEKDVGPFVEAIGLGLEDPAVKSREVARRAFVEFCRKFPQLKERMRDKCKSSLKFHLKDARAAARSSLPRSRVSLSCSSKPVVVAADKEEQPKGLSVEIVGSKRKQASVAAIRPFIMGVRRAHPTCCSSEGTEPENGSANANGSENETGFGSDADVKPCETATAEIDVAESVTVEAVLETEKVIETETEAVAEAETVVEVVVARADDTPASATRKPRSHQKKTQPKAKAGTKAKPKSVKSPVPVLTRKKTSLAALRKWLTSYRYTHFPFDLVNKVWIDEDDDQTYYVAEVRYFTDHKKICCFCVPYDGDIPSARLRAVQAKADGNYDENLIHDCAYVRRQVDVYEESEHGVVARSNASASVVEKMTVLSDEPRKSTRMSSSFSRRASTLEELYTSSTSIVSVGKVIGEGIGLTSISTPTQRRSTPRKRAREAGEAAAVTAGRVSKRA